MKYLKTLAFSYALAVLLAGCASVGFEPAKTFEDKLAYAVSQNAAVRVATTNALRAGVISKADAVQVLQLTNEARTLMDASRLAVGVGDISTAEARLSLATTILVKLNAYLQERGRA